MWTQKSPPKLNMEDSRADMDFVPHSSEDCKTGSLGDVETTPKIWEKSTQAHENF